MFSQRFAQSVQQPRLAWLLGLATLLSVALPLQAAQESPRTVTFESLLREMVDRDHVARLPDSSYQTLQESSWNRNAQAPDGGKAAIAPIEDKFEGWFANNDRGEFLRTEQRDGRTEYVLTDHQGPGAITRIWSATPANGGIIRIYLDGSDKPAIEESFETLTNGQGLVGEPLSAIRSRGHNLYLPIPFAKGCKITVDQNVGKGLFYIVNFRAYEPGVQVESFAMSDLDEHAKLLQRVQTTLQNPAREEVEHRDEKRLQQTIEPGQSVTLDLSGGPAAVRELTVKVDPSKIEDIDQTLRHLVLKASADGEATIHAPVGDFFGSGIGLNPFEDWYRTVKADGTLTARWTMPFQQTQSFTIENKGDKPVDVALSAKVGDWEWDDRSMTFRTNFRQERDIPTGPRKDFNFIAIDGTGVFVGDTLAISNPIPGWWGEGDEKIYVDDPTFPVHFGTGTEDYYGYAWCDPGLFTAPFHAQPRADGPRNFGHITNSRVRSLDAMPFGDMFVFDMEVWHWNRETEVAYAATTHWYGRPGAKATGPAASDEKDLTVPSLPQVERFENVIEGEDLEIAGKNGPFDFHEQALLQHDNGTWSGGGQLFARPHVEGKHLDVRVPTPNQGPQKLTLWLTKGRNYGIVQVSVNGEPIGEPIDLWSDSTEPTGSIELGTFTPTGENATLRFEVVGKNADSQKPGTFFGIDALRIEPAQGTRVPVRPR